MAAPTMVRLDFEKKPPSEILESLQEQSGLPMAIPKPSFEQAIPNLRAPVPVPFWEAVERVCEVGGLEAGIENIGGSSYPDLSISSLHTIRHPISVSGPFLVELRGLYHHRDLTLTGGPWLRDDRFGQRVPVPRSVEPLSLDERFYAALNVKVEPRMWFAQTGPARVVEAVDDLGQSLKPRGEQEMAHQSFFSYRGITAHDTKLPLRYPERPGSTIKRLRGVMPVVLERREPEPAWTVPLGDFEGRTFHDGGLVLEVAEVKPGDQRTLVVLAVTIDEDGPLAGDHERSSIYTGDIMERQVEIVDAEGRVLNGSGSGDRRRMNFHAKSKEGSGPAATLLYYRMVRVETEFEFAFTDLPMP
jgi:hypothetical protein